jgi:hypothetical protein
MDDSALTATFGTHPPATFDRAGRVRLIGEAAQALLAGRVPSLEASMFLGGALAAWLETGGDLARDYLRVVKAKSHHTPAYIWNQLQAHQDERQLPDDDATLAPSSPEHHE